MSQWINCNQLIIKQQSAASDGHKQPNGINVWSVIAHGGLLLTCVMHSMAIDARNSSSCPLLKESFSKVKLLKTFKV